MNWLFGNSLCIHKAQKPRGTTHKLIPKANIDNKGNIGTYGIIDNRQIVKGNAESKQSDNNVENK